VWLRAGDEAIAQDAPDGRHILSRRAVHQPWADRLVAAKLRRSFLG
jgi:hypothetical protein